MKLLTWPLTVGVLYFLLSRYGSIPYLLTPKYTKSDLFKDFKMLFSIHFSCFEQKAESNLSNFVSMQHNENSISFLNGKFRREFQFKNRKCCSNIYFDDKLQESCTDYASKHIDGSSFKLFSALKPFHALLVDSNGKSLAKFENEKQMS